METKEKILDDFETNRNTFKKCGEVYKRLIETLLFQNNMKWSSIHLRIKDKDSLLRKIQEKNKYESLNEITDIIGIRIITFFEDDAVQVGHLIKEQFEFDEVNSIDKKQQMLDENKFGYLSYHYIVTLSKKRCELIEYKNFQDIKVEIQIRSIMQHAWAEIEHDFGYKAPEKLRLPPKLKRSFSRLAALGEIVDNEFIRLRNEIYDYRKLADEKIMNNINEPIDLLNLEAFTAKSEIIEKICLNLKLHKIELDDYSKPLARTIDRCIYLKLITIYDLEKVLKQNESDIYNLYKNYYSKYYKHFPGIGYKTKAGIIALLIFYFGFKRLGALRYRKFVRETLGESVYFLSKKIIEHQIDLSIEIFQKFENIN